MLIVPTNDIEVVNLNRDPVLKQTYQFAQVKLDHELNDDHRLEVKSKDSVRDYEHVGDTIMQWRLNHFRDYFQLGIRICNSNAVEGCYGGFHNIFVKLILP